MNPLQMISFFLIFLIVGSSFIMGFYNVTRDGQIAGAWERFFDRHKLSHPVLSGVALLDKYIALEALEPDIYNKLLFDTYKHSLKKIEDISFIEQRKIEIVLGVKVEINGEYLFLRGEERKYKLPWKVRKLANCPICMSGWLGVIVFGAGIAFFGFDAAFYGKPFVSAPIAAIAYCVCLVFVNKAAVIIFE